MAKAGRPRRNPQKPRPASGARIALARAAVRLTQEQLAAAIGRSQTQIGAYETGQSEPDLATFDALGRALNVSPAWLAFGEPGDGDPLAGAAVQAGKHDRMFVWAFHRAARLLSEEGLEGDLAYIVAYARKLMDAGKGASDDMEAKERISAAIEVERSEIRRSLDQIRKSRL